MKQTNQLPHLIGLTGKARTGKDSTGEALIAASGGKYLRFAFADKLKELALEANPSFLMWEDGPHFSGRVYWNLQNLVSSKGWEGAKEIPAVRKFLQDLGVGARNVFGQDVWVEALFQEFDLDAARLRRLGIPRPLMVVCDVRFENEAQAIRNLGGQIWKTRRPDIEKASTDTHSSETELEGIQEDVTVWNTGDLDALFLRVGYLLELASNPRFRKYDGEVLPEWEQDAGVAPGRGIGLLEKSLIETVADLKVREGRAAAPKARTQPPQTKEAAA